MPGHPDGLRGPARAFRSRSIRGDAVMYGQAMNRETNPLVSYPVAAMRAEPAGVEDHSEYFNIAAIIATLWRAKLFIGFVAVAVAVAVGAVLVQIESVYTARATIQLLRGGTQIIDIANVVDTRPLGDAEILSEVSVVSSPRVLRRVAERLDLARYPEFQYQETPVREAIKAVRRFISGPRPSADAGSDDGGSPAQIAAGYLSDMVMVRQVGLTHILSIDATSPNPYRAAAIANAVAEEYLAQQIEDKFAASNQATEWLGARLTELIERVEVAEAAAQAKRLEIAAGGAVSPAVIGQQISELSSLLVGAKIARAEAIDRREQFATLIAGGLYASAAQVVESPTLRTSGERLAALRLQIAAARERAGEAETLRGLEAASAEVETSLRGIATDISAGLDAAVEVAANRITAIQTALAQLQLDQSAETARSRELLALERRVDTVQQVYQTFLTRLTETRERGSFQEANARIVASAGPPDAPSAPKRALLAALSFVLAAGAAAAWVLFRDMRRDGFKTAAAAARMAGVPVLASLPRNSRGPGAREELRRLDAAARRHAGDGGHVVLVTASLPGELGGHVAGLLAEVAAAALPGRVALLRADRLGRDAAAPAGCDVFRIEDLVEPKGPGTVSGPHSVLKALREKYAAVIVDAPPVLAATDALELARDADSVLLCVRWNRTPRGALRRGLEQFGWFSIGITGLVMTDVDTHVAATYGYAGEAETQRLLMQRWRAA